MNIAQNLEELHAKLLHLREGKVADYIPELAKADPEKFAIAVAGVDKAVHTVGDADHAFTLQSISKPFVYGLALEDHGPEHILQHVGVEPTGNAFNSIIELEARSHRPYNPMINSGAIAITHLLHGESQEAKLARLLDLFSRYTGRPARLNTAVSASESETGHRNRAIAHLLRHFGKIGDAIEPNLDLYFQQCAIETTTRDLAVMAATLANGGVQPWTGERVLAARHVRDLMSLMFTCGMYDSSGEWAYSVGIPAKSGVSGGILAVVPGRMGIAAFSPALDSHGHSVRGARAIRELSQRWGLSLFEATR